MLEQAFIEGLARGLEDSQSSFFEFRNRPVDFIQEVLRLTLWEKQEEVIQSVRDNAKTVVESGHGVGKSIAASLLVCWWLSVHEDAKVITLAPTYTQVANILWKYIRSYGRKSRLPGVIFDTPRWDITAERFGIGLSPKRSSEQDIATLQGYHSPYLLVIMDEAPALPKMLWDTVRNLAVGDNNRVLAIGNPIEQSGAFWEACNSQNWHKIRLNCLEFPNVARKREIIPGAVSYTWVREMVNDHCTIVETQDGNLPPGAFVFEGVAYQPDMVFESRVLGRAPAEASDQLIPLSWVETAKTWDIKPSGDVVLGLDPARFGGDPATLIARAGPKILWIKRRYPTSRNPGMELAGWLQEEANKLGAVLIYVDEVGVGSSVVDQGRTLGLNIKPVAGSRAAYQKKRFNNLRTECWFKVKGEFQKAQISIPNDHLLERDLTVVKYGYDEFGRLRLERKEEVKKRLGRSPDSGDALAITYANPVQSTLTDGVNPVRELKAGGPSKWSIGGTSRKSRWKKFSRL